MLTLQKCLEYLRHSDQTDIDFYTRKKEFLTKNALPDYIRLRDRYDYELTVGLADEKMYDCAVAEIERIEKLIDVCNTALFFLDAKSIVENDNDDIWNTLNNTQTIQLKLNELYELYELYETLHTKIQMWEMPP